MRVLYFVAGMLSISNLLFAAPKQQSYFISIDGLQPKRVQTLIDAGYLTTSAGLGDLFQNSLTANARSVVTTLTAASHISTITCSSPSKHGIVANGFLRDHELINGYTAEFASEPLWSAAQRQGKKVIALAYVGADGTSARRSATWGLGYPEQKYLGISQKLQWDLDQLPESKSNDAWSRQQKRYKTGSFSVELNPTTGERREIYFFAEQSDGRLILQFDTDRDLTNGNLGELDSSRTGDQAILRTYFTERDRSSALFGAKRNIFMRLLPSNDANKLRLYVSGSSYNNAYPASFRQALDRADLVWPQYGIRDNELDALEQLEAQAMIDRFLVQVAGYAQSHLDFDIMLFYQPLIDSIEHQVEGQLPEPYVPGAQDAVSQAYTRAYEVVDQNIAALLSRKSDDSVIALMGDHGMARIEKQLNLAPLLSADELSEVEITASGALAMLYAKEGVSSRRADMIGMKLRDALSALRYDDRRVLDQSLRRLDTEEGRWHHGDAVWAFMPTEPIWFTHNILSADTFITPSIFGMHGHSPNLPSMTTLFLINGPGIPALRWSETISLLDAVPTFVDAIGLAQPHDCEGHALLVKSQAI